MLLWGSKPVRLVEQCCWINIEVETSDVAVGDWGRDQNDLDIVKNGVAAIWDEVQRLIRKLLMDWSGYVAVSSLVRCSSSLGGARHRQYPLLSRLTVACRNALKDLYYQDLRTVLPPTYISKFRLSSSSTANSAPHISHSTIIRTAVLCCKIELYSSTLRMREHMYCIDAICRHCLKLKPQCPRFP
ncbi:hypothetical protein BU16DRAFT_2546 [Lophium mytilinum]|uniref:Uncharacterized protein n=1 Tax=Lophium mytilinum TaxID=390894 RepID=A0A6A6RBN6_9PEZI|nr:hypothetical protein BU16DRAFT_2546 [Lophium mytilinum]